MRSLCIAMAQINAFVGDLIGNTHKILEFIDQVKRIGAELITFPELSITGYPPEDLLLKPNFIDANISCLQKIIDASEAITIVVGFVDAVLVKTVDCRLRTKISIIYRIHHECQ